MLVYPGITCFQTNPMLVYHDDIRVALNVLMDVDYRSTGSTDGTPGSSSPVVLKVKTDSWYAWGASLPGGSEGLLAFRLREGRDRQLARLGVLSRWF